MSKKLSALIGLCVILFTSCFALPVEEPVPPPPVLAGGTEITYRTTEAARGDVSLFRELPASYVPAREQSPSFDIGDEYITAVYVNIGDTVEAGDVIAEIDKKKFEDELDILNTEEAWVSLELSQLEETFALKLEQADRTETQADDSEYTSARAELISKLEAFRLRREYLRLECERRVLHAGLSGMVTYALPFSEGLLSVAEKAVATIADQSESVFMVRGEETEQMETGNRYGVTIEGRVYDAVVIDPSDLGIDRASDEETYLVLTEDEQPVVTARTYARVTLVLDEAPGVIMIPSAAVKKANARVFVYKLEDGVRAVTDVEIGLEGNTHTEITSGLREGESVILN